MFNDCLNLVIELNTSMKALSVFIVLGLGMACETKFTVGHSGRPACETPGEIGGKFPNFKDFGYFWQCTRLNKDAQCIKCPIGEGFHSKLKMCIHWNNWRYFDLEDPPSLSNNEETGECELFSHYPRVEL